MTGRSALRWLLAMLYGAAGVVHLVSPGPFISITPGWVPQPKLVVALTGIAELLGAIGLLQSYSAPLRRAAGWGLAVYALCVWPANFNHMVIDMANPDGGLGLAYHVPRLAAQPLVIWLALWVSEATDWPFRKR
ncbi:MAG: DoxX family protein [Novosphingobium sp.]|nr:DoxX family protein [Novosphingobium sp.]